MGRKIVRRCVVWYREDRNDAFPLGSPYNLLHVPVNAIPNADRT